MADVVVPAAPPLARLNRVELIHTGQWKISTGTWTVSREDLIAAVAALDCPAVRRPALKLGHSLGQEPLWAGNPTGEPAVGWVDNLTLSNDGHTLVGDFVDLPGWLGQVMASAYPDRSVEGTYDFRCQIGHTHPFVLTAVALLGVTPPGVGTLRSLQDVARLYGVTTGGAVAAAGAADVDDEPLDPAGDDDPAVTDLLWALAYVAGELDPQLDTIEAAWNPANHPRWPKGTPGGKGGQFRSILAEKIQAWVDGDRSGDPLAGFTREQLRRAARRRGVQLRRGAPRDEIAEKLMDSVRTERGDQPDTGRSRSGVGIGRDLTGQDALPWDDIPMGDKKRRHEGDKALGFIYREQGFNGLPEIGSDTDVDAVVDAGGVELFRGVGDYTTPDGNQLQASDFIEQFKRGDYQPGFGVYGNGTYTSTEYGGGLKYAKHNEANVVRMALKPGARIVDRNELTQAMRAYQEQGDARGRILGDRGRLAAALGYDAIRIPNPYGQTDDYYVILNRTALIVQDTPAERFRNLRS